MYHSSKFPLNGMFGPSFIMMYLSVLSSFAIILMSKRKLVVLLYVTDNVLWLFHSVLWARRLCVIVVFSGHNHFLVNASYRHHLGRLHHHCQNLQSPLMALT